MVKFINLNKFEMIENLRKNQFYVFGDINIWDYYKKVLGNDGVKILNNCSGIVDNDSRKWGTTRTIFDKEYVIFDPKRLIECGCEVILIVCSLIYHKEICEQLRAMRFDRDVMVYSLPLMTYSRGRIDNSCVSKYFETHATREIPPIIHSFWFSGEEKPDIYIKCLDSWRTNCPDFEIKEWNLDNYDITRNRYLQQAIERKKWAFASDFARLDVVYRYGGIYLDMDVEILHSLSPLLNASAFFCRQEDGFLELGSGFGAPPGNEVIGKMLNLYNNASLIDGDGNIDITPQPERMASVYSEIGFENDKNSTVYGDIICLSNEYISCRVEGNSDDTLEPRFGIHWHNAGWMSDDSRIKYKESLRIVKKLENEVFIY